MDGALELSPERRYAGVVLLGEAGGEVVCFVAGFLVRPGDAPASVRVLLERDEGIIGVPRAQCVAEGALVLLVGFRHGRLDFALVDAARAVYGVVLGEFVEPLGLHSGRSAPSRIGERAFEQIAQTVPVLLL